MSLSFSWEISSLWEKLPVGCLWGFIPYSCRLSNLVWYACVCASFGVWPVFFWSPYPSSTFFAFHSLFLPCVFCSCITLMNDASCSLLITDLLWIQQCEFVEVKAPGHQEELLSCFLFPFGYIKRFLLSFGGWSINAHGY